MHIVSMSVFIIFSGLIAVSVVFELIQHALSHAVEAIFQPILEALYRELMGLGLLGIMLFFFQKFRVLQSLRYGLWGDIIATRH